MSTLLFTIILMAMCMAAMAVGVIVAGKRLHGSCGGPDSDDCVCEIEQLSHLAQLTLPVEILHGRADRHQRAQNVQNTKDFKGFLNASQVVVGNAKFAGCVVGSVTARGQLHLQVNPRERWVLSSVAMLVREILFASTGW